MNRFQGAPVRYPWRLSACGDFDICGKPRIQLYYRQIVWGSDQTCLLSRVPANMEKTEVLSRWGWPEAYKAWDYPGWEGRLTLVDVFSRADEVELLLNGLSLGRKLAGRANRYRALFEVTYMPGILTAISFTGGHEVSRTSLVTGGQAVGLSLNPERQAVVADGQSLVYIDVEMIDNKGQIVPFDDRLATAVITGPASLLAFGTARPVTSENYVSGSFTSYLGRWQAILRAGTEPGLASLAVSAEGLPLQTMEIEITQR